MRAREDELHRRLKEKEQVLNLKEEEFMKKVDLLDQQATELNRQIEQLRELQVRSHVGCESVKSHVFYPSLLLSLFTQSKERPPRLKRFKLKELWRRLFSAKGHEHVLPSRSNTHSTRRSDTTDQPHHHPHRRYGTSSYHRRQSSDGANKGENHGRYKDMVWMRR